MYTIGHSQQYSPEHQFLSMTQTSNIYNCSYVKRIFQKGNEGSKNFTKMDITRILSVMLANFIHDWITREKDIYKEDIFTNVAIPRTFSLRKIVFFNCIYLLSYMNDFTMTSQTVALSQICYEQKSVLFDKWRLFNTRYMFLSHLTIVISRRMVQCIYYSIALSIFNVSFYWIWTFPHTIVHCLLRTSTP